MRLMAIFLLVFSLIPGEGNLFAEVKELQIKAQLLNSVTLKPLAKAEAVVILYYINQTHTLKETHYKKRLLTNDKGVFTTPRLHLRVYPDQIYRLRVVLSHADCVDTDFFTRINLAETMDVKKYTFALKPKELPVKLKISATDVITKKLLVNNNLKLYLFVFDQETGNWQRKEKITKNTGPKKLYVQELPEQFSPSSLSNRFRFDLAVSHPDYIEILTRNSFRDYNKSTQEIEYYDFSTLHYDSYMIGEKSRALLTGFLTNKAGLPLSGKSMRFFACSGEIEREALIPDYSYQVTTDQKGRISFLVPNNYLYTKDQFVNLVGTFDEQSISQVYPQVLTRNHEIVVISESLTNKTNFTLLFQPQDRFLMPWTVGMWWKVRFSSRVALDEVLIFRVEDEPELDKQKYFQVSVSNSDQPQSAIAQLYFRQSDNSLGLVVYSEDNQSDDFDANSPVAFYEDYPYDFPIFEDIFQQGFARHGDGKSELDKHQVNQQRYFQGNSLIQTTKSQEKDKERPITTILDLTIDQTIYLTTINWLPRRPWWTSYTKETIDEVTSTMGKLCEAKLISYGYKDHTLFSE